MTVDGSVTNIDFTIDPHPTNDRFLKTLSFVIAGDGASLDEFGDIAALTNGVDLFYSDNTGQVFIGEALKTNWDFIRVSAGNPAFGTGADAFRAKNVEGKVDAYIPVIDLAKVFGREYGVRLKAKSTQKLIVRVKDDLTGVDSFNAVAYGFDRLPD